MPTRDDVPHNSEAERALLGSILLDNRAMLLALKRGIQREDFFSEANRILFSEMLELYQAEHPIDLVTLSQRITERGILAKAGGAAYIAALTDGVPVSAELAVSEYAGIVKDKSTRRRLITISNNLIARASDGLSESTEELLGFATLSLDNLTKEVISVSLEPVPTETAADKCPVVPEECFYGASKMYRDLLGELTEPSDSFHLACFISLMGAAIGRAVGMNMPKLTHPNQYIVLVGESAWARKGVAMSFAEDLLMAAPLVTVLTSVDSGEGIVRAIRDSLNQQDARRRSGVLFIIDELNAVLSKAGQKGSKIIPDLKRNYDWHPTLQINAGLAPVRIEDPPTFNLLAASEIDDLSDMQDRDLRGGLGNRLVYIPGEGKPPNADSAPPFRTDWYALVDHLRGVLDFWKDKSQGGTTVLKWSKEAHARWRVFYKSAKQRGESDPRVHRLAARHCIHVPKVAMLWAAMSKQTEYVQIDQLEAAIAWCEFQLEGLYHIFKTVGLKPWVREGMEIVGYIKRQGGAVDARRLRRRFEVLGGEGYERLMKPLIADDQHPDRELKEEKRIGQRGRKVKWITLNQE